MAFNAASDRKFLTWKDESDDDDEFFDAESSVVGEKSDGSGGNIVILIHTRFHFCLLNTRFCFR